MLPEKSIITHDCIARAAVNEIYVCKDSHLVCKDSSFYLRIDKFDG